MSNIVSKSRKPKCLFIKKDGKQCTNQQKIGNYCRTHIKYVKLGINHENIKINKMNKINKIMTPLKLDDCKISPYYLAGFFDGDGGIY